MHEMFGLKREYEESSNSDLIAQAKEILKEAEAKLAEINSKSGTIAKEAKWNGWYDVRKRRPNNGFPTEEMLIEIENAIFGKW